MNGKMTIVFSAIAAGIMLAAGCDNSIEEWSGGNGNSVGKPDGNEEEVVPPVSKDKWSALADSCTFVLTDSFLDKSKGTFWSTPHDIDKSSGNIYWQQAHALDVLIAAYERVKDKDKELAAEYEGYFSKWYENDANNYNNSHESEGVYGGFFNSWTDDMAWICLTLLRLSEATGIEKYADTSRDIFDIYIWPRATEDARGTGLPWTDRDQNKNNKNACTNSPSCLVAAKLYVKYGKKAYLEAAKKLYDFSIAIMPDSERVEEPPLTYTQGTFGEACRQLYHITGEKFYMDKAVEVIKYAFTGSRCVDASTGVLRHEGTNMDQSIFKAVLIPYAVNLVLDESADKASRKVIREKLMLCAETLDAHLDRNLYPQMYCNYFWGENFREGTASMGAQASGASLAEGVARMVSSIKE